ncbi:hypothetical protein GCM10007874_50620 [Labrys miyagiensis]|uniref:Uncharacterized protein n=1 Tax=Labrys miyagiensis TaxID=346912 RepID=A0ABQ6CST6_9HYPH|nr:hypothetical protein GCM10007874_50620 [Labrys miyagiensis]
MKALALLMLTLAATFEMIPSPSALAQDTAMSASQAREENAYAVGFGGVFVGLSTSRV